MNKALRHLSWMPVIIGLSAFQIGMETGWASGQPNILLIMADDMGYSDLGCYGGEIHTPNLDRLAKNGLRFTSFYNASRCCPTRASLLTGLYPHQAGVGRMTFEDHLPGYRGVLSRNAVTIAEVLKDSGYQTAMVGKWHLSPTREAPTKEQHLAWLNHQADYGDFSDPKTYPTARGFDEYYGNIWGVVNFFDPFSLVHNTRPIKQVPQDYYITEDLNNRAVELIEKYARDEKPFFLYLAHCAPHWPLHALPEDIEKYKNTYKVGWQRIREARYQRMIKMGLIDPKTALLSGRFPADKEWKNESHREWESRAMAVHAAMIDRLDQGVGRVISKLQQLNRLDNTLIMFLSDNGASPERPNRPGFDRNSETRDGRQVRYNDKSGMPGPETTYTGIGQDWANVANTPFRYWKKEQYHGGMATPFIAHWPKGIKGKPGSITRTPGHVIDIMATCLDVAGAEYPKKFNGNIITPLEGSSLVPIFKTGNRRGHEAIYFEHYGARGLRKGDWKLAALKGKSFSLFNLKQDFTETRDLAAEHPEKVKELSEDWQRWAGRAQVLPTPEQSRNKKNKKSQAGQGSSSKTRFELNQGDKLDGDARPAIANRGFTVKAVISKPPRNGVIICQGGWMAGFSLFVRDSRPAFVLRSGQKESTEIIGSARLPKTGRTEIGALVKSDGTLSLSVNGNRVAFGKTPRLVPILPQDGLAVGDDPDSNVGDYREPEVFKGVIHQAVLELGPKS